MPRFIPNSKLLSLSLKGGKEIYPYRCQSILGINTFTYFFGKRGSKEEEYSKVQAKKSLNTTHPNNTELLSSKYAVGSHFFSSMTVLFLRLVLLYPSTD